MELAGRPPLKMLRALLRRQHYTAAANIVQLSRQPLQFLSRYLLGTGAYPWVARVRTPTGELALKTWCHDDVLTINEIFFRLDYRSMAQDRVFVDFGSNIGISAAYFLSRSPEAFAYLYEPLPQNAGRLRENLTPFEGRYRFEPVAVGPTAGEFDFGWEDTGRYGGLGRRTGRSMRVMCRDARQVIEEIVERHGRIDVLKIDIETMEEEVVARLADRCAGAVRTVLVEYRFRANPLSRTHRLQQSGSVCRFSAVGDPQPTH